MFLNRMKKGAAKDADPRERSLWADLMSIGMVFPIAIFLGLLGGRWLGEKLGHQDLGQWLGLGLGIGAAFWELYKTTVKLGRFDAEELRSAKETEDAKRKAPLGGGSEDDDDRP
jgi:hypothetical protein